MVFKMFVHEGSYAAEISVEEIDDGSPYGPHVRKEDAFKLDRVRLALRRGDLAAASKDSKVYQMMPMAG
jgi:hypothetical protein